MPLKRRLLAPTVLVLITTLGWLVSDSSEPEHAPDVAFSTLEGRQFRLDTLRGRPVLINFWSTSCAACVREVPHLAALHAELAPRGLEIIGVAMPYDPPSRVVEMSRRKAIPYPIALDVRGNVVRAFGDVRLTPTTILVGPDGRRLYRKTGKLDVARVRALLQKLLGAPQLAHSQPGGS